MPTIVYDTDLDNSTDLIVRKLATELTKPDTATGEAFDALGIESSLKTYCAGDGVTNDQVGLVQAFANAAPVPVPPATAGTVEAIGKEVYAANGVYVSTASIPKMHSVQVAGHGAIKRGSSLYYFSPQYYQYSDLYVDTAGGSDDNDGLSPSTAVQTLQRAFDILALKGPVLAGLWRISLAAGTYAKAALNSTLASIFPIEIRGPATTWPTTPTAIIAPGTGPTDARGLDFASNQAVRVSNVLITGFTGGTGINAGGGKLSLDNVHCTNNLIGVATGTKQELILLSPCKVDGNDRLDSFGIRIGFNSQITSHFETQPDTNVPVIQYCTYGVFGHEGAYGHLDGTKIYDCTNGLTGVGPVRFNTDRMRIWKCTNGLRCYAGASITDNGIDFGEGVSSKECTNKKVFDGGSEEFGWRGTHDIRNINRLITPPTLAYNTIGQTETEIWRSTTIKSGDVSSPITEIIQPPPNGIDGTTFTAVHELIHLFTIRNVTATTANVVFRVYFGAVNAGRDNLVTSFTLLPSASGTMTFVGLEHDILSPNGTYTTRTGSAPNVVGGFGNNTGTTIDLKNGSDTHVLITMQFAGVDTGASIQVPRLRCQSTFGRKAY